MIAKAYRLLHAVLNTALDDELIRRNPCRIRGAGEAHTPERPVATVAQVLDLAGRVPARFRALILLAAFTGLRYGELAALRRTDLAADLATVTVRATLTTLTDGTTLFGPPKSKAGRRTVTVPEAIREDLRLHLRDYVRDDPDALIFTGAKGAVLRRSGFQTQSRWAQPVAQAGLTCFHFHDLRHTGNTLAAGTGASLADLMARMGPRLGPRRNDLSARHPAARHHDRRRAQPQHRPRTRSGTQRARGPGVAGIEKGPGLRQLPLTWAFAVERATRIELA